MFHRVLLGTPTVPRKSPIWSRCKSLPLPSWRRKREKGPTGMESLLSMSLPFSEVQEGQEGPSRVTVRCLGSGIPLPGSDFPQSLFPLCLPTPQMTTLPPPHLSGLPPPTHLLFLPTLQGTIGSRPCQTRPSPSLSQTLPEPTLLTCLPPKPASSGSEAPTFLVSEHAGPCDIEGLPSCFPPFQGLALWRGCSLVVFLIVRDPLSPARSAVGPQGVTAFCYCQPGSFPAQRRLFLSRKPALLAQAGGAALPPHHCPFQPVKLVTVSRGPSLWEWVLDRYLGNQ